MFFTIFQLLYPISAPPTKNTKLGNHATHLSLLHLHEKGMKCVSGIYCLFLMQLADPRRKLKNESDFFSEKKNPVDILAFIQTYIGLKVFMHVKNFKK